MSSSSSSSSFFPFFLRVLLFIYFIFPPFLHYIIIETTKNYRGEMEKSKNIGKLIMFPLG